MAVNADKPERWKADIAQSVDMYNNWFLQFAPGAYRDSRIEAVQQVRQAFLWTNNLQNIHIQVLREHPVLLPILRMVTAPPLARDRLVGLARVERHLVETMEIHGQLPPRMAYTLMAEQLQRVSEVIARLIDKEICVWLERNQPPDEAELYRVSTIIADRLCGAITDPIIRNAQEHRQLLVLSNWLNAHGYTQLHAERRVQMQAMQPATYAFRLNVPVMQENLQGQQRQVNIPVDAVIKSRYADVEALPLLIEAKSAGDFTNPNKRRKEEATKIAQLRKQYGSHLHFILFLCGYFDSGYLGYEAAEGIDWVWEHRIDDFVLFGV